jgi:hypothetical protein
MILQLRKVTLLAVTVTPLEVLMTTFWMTCAGGVVKVSSGAGVGGEGAGGAGAGGVRESPPDMNTIEWSPWRVTDTVFVVLLAT